MSPWHIVNAVKVIIIIRTMMMIPNPGVLTIFPLEIFYLTGAQSIKATTSKH